MHQALMKWGSYIEMFDTLRDINGDFRHYPESGGYYEQDAVTMSILQVIRREFKNTKRQREKEWEQKHRSSSLPRI